MFQNRATVARLFSGTKKHLSHDETTGVFVAAGDKDHQFYLQML
ncbi:hypothetical protein QP475_09855 [Lacticaseibacillus rhamnosus]|nr:hypothetical protein [Lacticaseibacillus rhamnosus]